MKLTKLTVMTLATLAMSAMAYATPHNFNVFSSNQGSFGALLDYPTNLSPFNNGAVGYPPLSTNTYVTNGEQTLGNYGTGTADHAFLSPSAQTCGINGTGSGTQPCSAALSYTTGPVSLSNFGLIVAEFFDADSNIVSGTATLTSGSGTYFWTADDGTAADGLKPQSFDNFLEIDITLGAYDTGNGGPVAPGGVFRIGYGINGNLSNVSLLGLTGVDAGGNFVVTGTSTAFNRGEGPEPQSFVLLDAEFDPVSTPEPTTLLLMGSGLLVVARRFRR